MTIKQGLLWLVLWTGGCASEGIPGRGEEDPPASSGAGEDALVPDGDAPDDLPDAGPIPGLTLSWSVANYSALSREERIPGAPAAPPIEGVEICVSDRPAIPCVSSDSSGFFVLRGLPAATVLVVTFEHADYVPQALTIETESANMAPTAAVYLGARDRAVLAPGFTQDASKGALNFIAIEGFGADAQFVSGASVVLEPARGDGPFYADPNTGDFDVLATSTLGDFGAYLNLDPGEYTLTFSHPELNCAPSQLSFGGLGIAVPPSSIRFTILASYRTSQIIAFCLPKPAPPPRAD